MDELTSERKPCFVKKRGIERGAFLRTHDGDRALSSYEVHVLLSSRGQPRDDMAVVAGTGFDDLDLNLVIALTRRLRETRGPIFSQASDQEILRLIGVTAATTSGEAATLAGLLALGRYPQRFFPQLDVTFVAYPTVSGEPLGDGTRFLDNQSIDGSIPTMVAGALAAMRRNMKRRSVIVGLGREDRWEYPEEVVRELVANALTHRDYHSLSHGTQVRIALYPDRFEVGSPGGLHGPIAHEDLLAEPVSSLRNSLLAKLLEDVEIPGTNRTVCENRGSGLLATAAALRAAGVEPPELIDHVREFRVVIKNHGLLDDDALAWLRTIDTAGLSDRQRLGLAFVHKNARITNQQYRTVTGCDSLSATRDLSGLSSSGLLVKANDRRWTVWHLAPGLERQFASLVQDEARASRTRGDRRDEIRSLLVHGPQSTRTIATEFGLSPQAVLRWIRQMEQDGQVRPTSSSSRSRLNRWELIAGTSDASLRPPFRPPPP